MPTLRRLGLPWLVWLAVLLPLAQAAGAWHEIGHLGETGSAEGGGKAGHSLGACVVCLGSPSAVGAAPLAHAVAAAAPPAATFARPDAPLAAGRRARSPAAYLSRAPPALPT
ncbi:hypothetical protein [Ideonella sp.]|uniref:hypothetical protein n=1 Tax=Ideonella sp. TaxID=1929293 RepID=UPI0035AFF8CE